MLSIKPEELKASILQYAIEGKLVEQRAEEGTAEELYKQIRAEKQKLIKEGKIKKEKPLPEISEDEIPFDIPESWKWVRLGECVTILGDGIHGTPKYSVNGEYHFINGNNLSDGVIEIKPDTKTVSFEEYELHKKELNDHTVFVSINGTIGNVAFYNGEKIILGKSACYFNLIQKEWKEYIFWIIKSDYFLKYAITNATGSTIKNVSLASMKSFPIPLPPLAEQRRIVAKIEELLPYVDRYAEAYDRLEQFYNKFPEEMKKSVLQYAIEGRLVEQRAEEGTAEELYKQIRAEKQKLIKEGKIKKEKPLPEITENEIPFDIPESWKWVRLASLLTVKGGKRIPAGRKHTKIPTSRIYIRVTDMQNGTISNNDLHYVPEDIIDEISNYIITKEDIYIVIVGSIGKCGLVPEEFSGMNLTENAARLTPYFVDKKYLYYILSSTFMQNQFIDKTHQVGVPKLAIIRLETSLIPLPPLAEQRRIVAKVEELLPLCERLAECREKA